MTVAELIRLLSRCDPTAVVGFTDGDDIDIVESVEPDGEHVTLAGTWASETAAEYEARRRVS